MIYCLMNVCGRHLSGGHYESQSPDGMQVLPLSGSGGQQNWLSGRSAPGLVVDLKGQQFKANKGTFSYSAGSFRNRTLFFILVTLDIWRVSLLMSNRIKKYFLIHGIMFYFVKINQSANLLHYVSKT